MTTQERLERAATIGDRLAGLVRSLAHEDRDAEQAVEAWELHMADCQRSAAIAPPAEPQGDEEWGVSASGRTMEGL